MKTHVELLKQVEAFKVAFWELQCDLHVTIGETKNKELRSIQRTLFSIGDSVRQLPPLPTTGAKWQGKLIGDKFNTLDIDEQEDVYESLK